MEDDRANTTSKRETALALQRGIDEVRKYYAGSGSGGPENLGVEFDPGELEDLGDGHVSAVNHQVYRWKESGELAYERRARIEYTIP